MKIEVFTLECRLSNRECIFFEVKGSWQLELLLVEAASGVTPAIQGLNICSGIITSKILGGGGDYPQDSRGVFTLRILGGIFTPRILGGGIYPQDSIGW